MAAAGLIARPAISANADAVYTVANYPVEATAANAVAAKDQALADGQQAAFRSLLKRLVPVTAYKQLTRVSDVKAGDLSVGRLRALGAQFRDRLYREPRFLIPGRCGPRRALAPRHSVCR